MKKIPLILLSLFLGFIMFAFLAIIFTILDLFLAGHGNRVLSFAIIKGFLSMKDIIAIAGSLLTIFITLKKLLIKTKNENLPGVRS